MVYPFTFKTLSCFIDYQVYIGQGRINFGLPHHYSLYDLVFVRFLKLLLNLRGKKEHQNLQKEFMRCN